MIPLRAEYQREAAVTKAKSSVLVWSSTSCDTASNGCVRGEREEANTAHSNLLMHHCQAGWREKEANPQCKIVSQAQAVAAAMQSAVRVEKLSAKGAKVTPWKQQLNPFKPYLGKVHKKTCTALRWRRSVLNESGEEVGERERGWFGKENTLSKYSWLIATAQHMLQFEM